MLSSIIIFTGCSSRILDFTVISSKNVTIKFDKSQGKFVTGKSMGFLGMGISIKDAMDKALSSAGPDYDILVDGVIRVSDYFFVTGYKVEGTAYSSAKLKAQMGEKGFKDWCRSNNIFKSSRL